MKYLFLLMGLVFALSSCYAYDYEPAPYYPQQVYVGGYWYMFGGVRTWMPGRYINAPRYNRGGGYHGGSRGGYHGGSRGGYHGGHR